MRSRLPLEIKGELVRLRKISREDGRGDWDLIMDRQWDGQWYSLPYPDITGLMDASLATLEQEVKRQYRRIERRQERKGWTSKELTIRATLVDGVCFRWTPDPRLTVNKYRRKARKRMEETRRQKEWRQKQQESKRSE